MLLYLTAPGAKIKTTTLVVNQARMFTGILIQGTLVVVPIILTTATWRQNNISSSGDYDYDNSFWGWSPSA